ncbi:ABC transporter ATP-binding protein [Caldivirga sp.]|uniref:ABC transporter ATP-binding protein n=1 Tax=Caldivirga sp. TaxID=2080243 RepID=UPI0025BD5571|nr:ABC transporter ATP-binding protein [Caldivirga sp.]
MKYAVEVENLTVYYFGASKPALRNISLKIKEGEFILLVGRTGSGKSTLLNVINGVIPNVIEARVRGKVSVFDRDPRKTPVHEMATLVGTVYQVPESQIFSLIVDDDVAFGLENRAVEPSEIKIRVEDALKLTGLWNKRRHPTFLLSGGEKQRLAIAGMLALRPRLLILDEPTSMLDSLGAEEIFTLVRKLNDDGLTVVMSEHRVERVIGYVDRIVALSNGSLVVDDEAHKALAKISELGIEEPQVATLYRMFNRGNPQYYPTTINEFIEMGGLKQLEQVLNHVNHNTVHQGNAIAEASDLWFTYPGNQNPTLRGINVKFPEGAIISVIGPNGSGKSTLMYLMVGIYSPTRGNLRIMGLEPYRLKGKERVRLVGYVFQDPDQMIFSTSVKGELEFTLKNSGVRGRELEARVMNIARELNIIDLLNRDPHKLSVGQRRLVTVASVLVAEPRVLILDEPTRGLDHETGEQLMRYIEEVKGKTGSTVIMVTHNMRQVGDYSSRVYVMYDGKIVYDGSPEDVFCRAREHPEWGISPPQVFEVTRRLNKPVANLRGVVTNAASTPVV